MDLFMSFEDGVEKLVNDDSNQALFAISDAVHFFKEYHCQVQSVWTNPPMLFHSMYLRKDSHLTPFITHQLIKLQEVGATHLLYLRNRIAEPNCQPIERSIRSLGMDKALFLLLALCLAYVSAVIIFGLEHVCRK